MELSSIVEIVVYQTVGVTVETASTLSWFKDRCERRRQFLRCLDIICTAGIVQRTGSSSVGVHRDQLQLVANVFRKFEGSLCAYAIRAIDNEGW